VAAEAISLGAYLSVRHWYRISFTSHDFIIAAMIFCLDLRHKSNQGMSDSPGPGMMHDYQDKVVLHSLKTSCDIWMEAKNSSPEASKIYHVLSHMLNTLGMNAKAIRLQHQEVSTATTPDPAQIFPVHNVDSSLEPESCASLPDMEMDWVS
jgi:hypothetical protein